MLVHELRNIGAVIRDTKAYRKRRVVPERLRDLVADLEHRILDCLLVVHDAQAEEQVPDDTTGSGCEQEARQRVQNETMAVHVEPALHQRHEELASTCMVLSPSHLGSNLSPKFRGSMNACHCGLLLRIGGIRVFVVAEQGARPFVPPLVASTHGVPTYQFGDLGVHPSHHSEPLPVAVTSLHEAVLHVGTHHLAGQRLVLVGIVSLARVEGPAYLTRGPHIPCTGGCWRIRNAPRPCVCETWGLGY